MPSLPIRCVYVCDNVHTGIHTCRLTHTCLGQTAKQHACTHLPNLLPLPSAISKSKSSSSIIHENDMNFFVGCIAFIVSKVQRKDDSILSGSCSDKSWSFHASAVGSHKKVWKLPRLGNTSTIWSTLISRRSATSLLKFSSTSFWLARSPVSTLKRATTKLRKLVDRCKLHISSSSKNSDSKSP